VSSRVLVLRNQTNVVPSRLVVFSLFSAASFSDVTRDGSAIYRYSAEAGGPQYYSKQTLSEDFYFDSILQSPPYPKIKS
ncbi:hypothetical protein AVEN_109377-1, partial [Araneus ventricosus]